MHPLSPPTGGAQVPRGLPDERAEVPVPGGRPAVLPAPEPVLRVLLRGHPRRLLRAQLPVCRPSGATGTGIDGLKEEILSQE